MRVASGAVFRDCALIWLESTLAKLALGALVPSERVALALLAAVPCCVAPAAWMAELTLHMG